MARKRDIGKQDILDAAERFFQTVGYNGFSIRDLGADVGITSASLHHHFPTKEDLGTATLERYRERLNKVMAEYEAESDDWVRRRHQIIGWFKRACTEGRICLLSAFSSDLHTLPPRAQEAVRLLHSNLLGWLTRFVLAAQRQGQESDEQPADDIAAGLLAQIQGGILMSRTAPASPDEPMLHWLD